MQVFAPLGRLIPKFDAMVNGMVSLISLSDLSLSVCRNAGDSCVLVLSCNTLADEL